MSQPGCRGEAWQCLKNDICLSCCCLAEHFSPFSACCHPCEPIDWQTCGQELAISNGPRSQTISSWPMHAPACKAPASVRGNSSLLVHAAFLVPRSFAKGNTRTGFCMLNRGCNKSKLTHSLLPAGFFPGKPICALPWHAAIEPSRFLPEPQSP